MDFFSNKNEDNFLKDLLRNYFNKKNGSGHAFIDLDEYENIVEYFASSNKISAAIEAAETCLNYFPNAAGMLYKLAELLVHLKKFNVAQAVLKQAERINGFDTNLFLLKAEIALGLKQKAIAYNWFEKGLEQFNGDEKIELLFQFSYLFDDFDDYGKVFECIKMLLVIEPTNEEALIKICFWADYLKKYEESVEIHTRIVDNFPYCETAWFNLGLAYHGLKLFEKAVDAFLYSLAIDETFDAAYRNMAESYIKLRKYTEAIESIENVLEITIANETNLLELIGDCYNKQNKFSDARLYYKKSIQASADNKGTPFFKIAQTFFKELNIDKAIPYLENALKFGNDNPQINLLLGECKLEQGNFKDALLIFGHAIRLKPKNVAGWEALLRSLIKHKYYAEALEQMKNALKLTKNSGILVYYNSAILFGLNRQEEGISKLEAAIKQNKNLRKRFFMLEPQLLENILVQKLLNNKKKKV